MQCCERNVTRYIHTATQQTMHHKLHTTVTVFSSSSSYFIASLCMQCILPTWFVCARALCTTELETMTISQLNELYLEMEVLIRELSETLISELASRDELEYEKELKNTFISLLLAVQNKRRQFHVEKKRGKTQTKPATPGKIRKYV